MGPDADQLKPRSYPTLFFEQQTVVQTPKKEREMKNVALCLAVAALAAGCASKEARQDAPVTDRYAGVSQPGQASTITTSWTAQQFKIAGNPMRDPSDILYRSSVSIDSTSKHDDSNNVRPIEGCDRHM